MRRPCACSNGGGVGACRHPAAPGRPSQLRVRRIARCCVHMAVTFARAVTLRVCRPHPQRNPAVPLHGAHRLPPMDDEVSGAAAAAATLAVQQRSPPLMVPLPLPPLVLERASCGALQPQGCVSAPPCLPQLGCMRVRHARPVTATPYSAIKALSGGHPVAEVLLIGAHGRRRARGCTKPLSRGVALP